MVIIIYLSLRRHLGLVLPYSIKPIATICDLRPVTATATRAAEHFDVAQGV